MPRQERPTPAGGETSSALPQGPFSLADLHSDIRKDLRHQLSGANQLSWIKYLDTTLAGEESDYQVACLGAASYGLLLEKLPAAARVAQNSWINYIAASYPDEVKTGDRLPNPNRQAQDRNLDQATVVAAHREVTKQSKQALMSKVQADDPLAATSVRAGLAIAVHGDTTPFAEDQTAATAPDNSNLHEIVDQPLEALVTRVQLELAAKAREQSDKIRHALPAKSAINRLGASVLKRPLLSVTPEKNDRSSHEANRAARKLVKILKDLGDPEHIGKIVTDSVSTDFVDTTLASHYGRMIRAAKTQLAADLEQVPVTFAIPTATKKPRPKQPPAQALTPTVTQPTPLAKPAEAAEEPQAEVAPVSTEAETEAVIPELETVKPLTPAQIEVKKLYQTALEKYFELFSRKELRRPELAQFAGVLRKTPDTANKACLFLALASFSGDNRAIHDAFVTIENLDAKHLRSPLYGLCNQAYARSHAMPEQEVYALARQANPNVRLPHNRDEHIRPGTAFTDDTETRRGPDAAIVEITTRVEKSTLQELLGELDILFPEPASDSSRGMPTTGERRQKQYVQLPALKESRVRSILQRLGCELDTTGGKGSHVKVFNPATEVTTTISSDKGEVNPIPLSGLLDQLGIEREDFVKAMRGGRI